MKIVITLTCANCGRPLWEGTGRRKYCSALCMKRAMYKREVAKRKANRED